jgi:hypothetical protein
MGRALGPWALGDEILRRYRIPSVHTPKGCFPLETHKHSVPLIKLRFL